MDKKIILKIIAVVIIFSGVSGILGYWWQRQLEKENIYQKQAINLPPAINLGDNQETQLKLPPIPALPASVEINTYTGQIIELTAQKLILDTNYGKKTVLFDEQTAFEKMFVSKFPPLPPVPGSKTQVAQNTIPAPEKISWKTLLTGQKVQTFSSTNVRNQEEFKADKISLIVKLDK